MRALPHQALPATALPRLVCDIYSAVETTNTEVLGASVPYTPSRHQISQRIAGLRRSRRAPPRVGSIRILIQPGVGRSRDRSPPPRRHPRRHRTREGNGIADYPRKSFEKEIQPPCGSQHSGTATRTATPIPEPSKRLPPAFALTEKKHAPAVLDPVAASPPTWCATRSNPHSCSRTRSRRCTNNGAGQQYDLAVRFAREAQADGVAPLLERVRLRDRETERSLGGAHCILRQ